MAGQYQMTWIDSTQEQASVSYPVTSPATDGSDYQSIVSNLLTMRDAILAVCIDPALTASNYVATRTKFSPPVPTNPLNQVEQRWIVSYNVDGLSGLYREPIPCANLALGTAQQGVVILDTGSGAGATLQTQIEANWFVQAGVDSGGTGAVSVVQVYAESS